jgi:hypothetical protein
MGAHLIGGYSVASQHQCSSVVGNGKPDFQESNMKKARMASVALLSLVASLALAGVGNSRGDNNQGHEHAWGHDQRAVSAPEIDPGQAMGALGLLGGTLAIIRGYRRKK